MSVVVIKRDNNACTSNLWKTTGERVLLRCCFCAAFLLLWYYDCCDCASTFVTIVTCVSMCPWHVSRVSLSCVYCVSCVCLSPLSHDHCVSFTFVSLSRYRVSILCHAIYDRLLCL